MKKPATKIVNQQIVREIESYAGKHDLTKKEAAEALLAQFDKDGLIVSASHVQHYLDVLGKMKEPV